MIVGIIMYRLQKRSKKQREATYGHGNGTGNPSVIQPLGTNLMMPSGQPMIHLGVQNFSLQAGPFARPDFLNTAFGYNQNSMASNQASAPAPPRMSSGAGSRFTNSQWGNSAASNSVALNGGATTTTFGATVQHGATTWINPTANVWTTN
jgi:hypothetical protein